MTVYPQQDFRSLIQRWTPQLESSTQYTNQGGDHFESCLNSSSKPVSKESLIKSMGREPLPELLKYWDGLEQSDKGILLKQIYTEGLTVAVSKERYPCFLLDLIKNYPEFYPAVLDGLMVMWRRLRFSLVCHNPDSSEQIYELCIDSIRGQDIFFSDQDKNNISELIADNNHPTSIDILIGNINRNTRVILSEKGTGINQRISWLQKAIYDNNRDKSGLKE